MTRTDRIELRRPLSSSALYAVIAVTAAATAGVQYVWLHAETPLTFRILGVPFIAAYLVPLPFAIGLLRFDPRISRAWRSMFGSVWLWLAAFALPAIVFGAGVAAYSSAGGEVDPDWRWITLAWSALFDLPLMCVLLAPMLLAQEGVYRLTISLASGGRASIAHALLTSVLWTASQAVLLLHVASATTPVHAGSVAVMLLGAGAFAFRLQVRGAILPASCAVLTTALCAVLLFGCDIPEITRVLLGEDVTAIPPLLSRTSPFFDTLPAIAGGALLVCSLLISPRVKE